MPVARIYTRFPDEATELAERLRARGYTIELVDPGDFRVTPADLEIQLDRLKPEEAMAAAARFARAHEAEVFLAPGIALDEPALRAAREGAAERGNALLEGFKKLISPFRRAGASAHATRAARRQQKLDLELAREAERKRKAEQKAAENEAREREQAERDAKWATEREIVLARQREEDARRQEERARHQEEERKRREEEARLAAQREAALAEQRRKEEEALAEQRRREEEDRRQHAEAAARLAAEEAERRRVAEEQERAQREREAEIAARVAEQQRLAEEERRGEEEQRRVAEAAALAEAKRRDAETRPAMAAAAAATTAAASRPQPVIARMQQERQGHNARVMKRATIAAAVVAGVMALGWGAYENRTPAQPLSNSDLVHGQQIKQEVPFGPASIAAQQQQTTPATVRPPQAQTKQAQAAPAKPAAQAGGKPAPRRKARQFKSSPDDVDQVAEDQVIYHGAPKHSSGQASAQQPQSGVKHYSDIADGPQ